MHRIEQALVDHGVATTHLHIERFSSTDLPGPTGPLPAEAPGTVRVTITIESWIAARVASTSTASAGWESR